MSEQSGCGSCTSSSCSAKTPGENESVEQFMERQALAEQLCKIMHKIVVMSGKGGVGKSTVAVNLAIALAQAGKNVGLLDVDIHGPSIPKLLNLSASSVQTKGEKLVPLEVGPRLKVMSVGLLLEHEDDALIWRGPMKIGVIKQFLKDVCWDELDYLVIDSPPGTGDEPLSVCQFIPEADGAVIVTTPQEVALADVRKSIKFCEKVGMKILGVIENMSGFSCPHCGEVTEVFGHGGGEEMAEKFGLRFLGRIPIDAQIAVSGDQGRPYLTEFCQTPARGAFAEAIGPLLELDNDVEMKSTDNAECTMKKIAIPVVEGRLSMHFGHCEEFVFFTVDMASKKVVDESRSTPPPHEPGVLPKWLGEQGVNLIIAGGMGQRAQGLFVDNGIEVQVGAPVDTPLALVEAYMAGSLETGANVCDH